MLGLGAGALTAGIAVGLVLMYRGSGIINIATGGVAMLAAYAFWSMRTGFYGPVFSTPVAAVLTLLVAVLAGLLMELVAFRPLRTAPPLAKLVASLGVLLIAQAAMLLGFGPAPKAMPNVLPTDPVVLFDVPIPRSMFILPVIVIVITAALAALYRWSRFGLETRAAFENEAAARWTGLSPDRLALANTVLGCAVVAVLAIVTGSIITADPRTLPLQVVPGLAAALFARFTSFAVACLAGLGIGVGQSLLYYASTQRWFPTDQGIPMPGMQPLLVFVLIVIALFVRGSSLPSRGDFVEQSLPAVPVPERLARPALLGGLGCVVALVVLPFDFRQALMNSVIAAVLILSLVVITGFVGQVSVVQLALSGVAGFIAARLAADYGIGFPLGALVGIAAATALGLLIGISALRVRGVQLAVVTLAAAVAIERFYFANSTWGGGQKGRTVPQPELFGVDLGSRASFRGVDGNLPSPVLGFFILVVAIGLCLFVANLRRSSLGQRMVAVRANERAAAAVGVNVRNVKIAGFTISSFIAGVAGVLYAYNFGSVSANRFSALTALGLIAFAYIGGITMVSGALIAGFISIEAFFPHAWEAWLGLSGTWALLLGGIFLIFNLVFYPDGAAGAAHRKRQLRRAGLASPSLLAVVTGRRRSQIAAPAGRGS